MKSEDVIFENVMQKLQEYKKNKKQKTGRVLSGVATIVILISILFPIIYTFNNNKTNSVESSNSASKNFSNPLQNSIDKSIGLGEETNDVPYIITYEELLTKLNKMQNFKSFIPKSDAITSISDTINTVYNQTHWLSVTSNRKERYWKIRYFYYGFETIESYYYDYQTKEEVEFNGQKGYICCDSYTFEGAVNYLFNLGDGAGVVLTYYLYYNEIIEPETVLKEIFY